MRPHVLYTMLALVPHFGCGEGTATPQADAAPLVEEADSQPAAPDVKPDAGQVVEADSAPDADDDAKSSTLGCFELLECLDGCNADKTCVDACVASSTPESVARYDATIACVVDARSGPCKASCGGSPSQACIDCFSKICNAELVACGEDGAG